MKTQLLILVISIFLGSAIYAQRQKFDCNNINSGKVLSAYDNLKFYGLQRVVKTSKGDAKDIMELAIFYLKPDEIQQICINAWSEVENNGADYCYKRYVTLRGFVSKALYMENIDYFEMLHEIRRLLVDNLQVD